MARMGLVFCVVSAIALQVFAADPPKPAAAELRDRSQHPHKYSIPNAVRPPTYAPSVPGTPYTPPLTPAPPQTQGRPAPTPAYPPTPAYRPSATRKRLVLRLKNVPATDVAEALGELLDREQSGRGPYSQTRGAGRVVFVPEPISNSLVISGEASQVEQIKELIFELDVRPVMVAVDVVIAEHLPTEEGAQEGESAEDAPSMEYDGAAWIEWVMKSKRVGILSRPRIMTLDNQKAFIQIGQRAPLQGSTDGQDDSKQVDVGLTFGLTPRVSSEGVIVMALEVEHSSIAQCCGEPVLRKTSAQTTISARDNQTIVLGGLVQRSDDDSGQLVIVVTPRICQDADSEASED